MSSYPYEFPVNRRLLGYPHCSEGHFPPTYRVGRNHTVCSGPTQLLLGLRSGSPRHNMQTGIQPPSRQRYIYVFTVIARGRNQS